MNSDEEYLDLVDGNDQVIGKKKRTEVHAEGLHNYRAANAFIINSEGKLWIPLRAPHKAISPLGLDMSMGAHVSSGETYEEAFKREMMEELNIDTDAVPYRLLHYFKGGVEGLHAGFQKIYELQMDEAPDYSPNDFIDYFWLTPEEVLERAARGEKMKEDLPTLVRLLYTR